MGEVSPDEDVYGGGPPTTGSTSEDDRPIPLGVPDYHIENGKRVPGFQVPKPVTATGRSRGWGHPFPRGTTVTAQAPLYNEGYQLTPAQTSPAEIGRLQGSLAAAGLLDAFTYGVWDKPSQDAFADLLSESNVAGITWEAQLSKRAKTFTSGGGGGTGRGSGGGGGGGHWEMDETGEPVWVADQYQRPPLQLRQTNRDDLTRALRTGIIEKMGVGWSQAQVEALADQYLAQEAQVQRNEYNQKIGLEEQAFGGVDVSGQTITTQEPITPETFMEKELMRQDPVGYQAGGVINQALPQFIQALKGWV